MSPEQCRAARALLNWPRETLCREANVSMSTLYNFETGRRRPIPANTTMIRSALEGAGVEFLDGNVHGVRLKMLRSTENTLLDRQ